jgi:S1-C subfamily serine protease
VVIREMRYQVPGRTPQPVLVVYEVPANSAAAGGLQVGDMLLSVDGQAVRDFRSLNAALSTRQGRRVVRILRDNQTLEAAINVR